MIIQVRWPHDDDYYYDGDGDGDDAAADDDDDDHHHHHTGRLTCLTQGLVPTRQSNKSMKVHHASIRTLVDVPLAVVIVQEYSVSIVAFDNVEP